MDELDIGTKPAEDDQKMRIKLSHQNINSVSSENPANCFETYINEVFLFQLKTNSLKRVNKNLDRILQECTQIGKIRLKFL